MNNMKMTFAALAAVLLTVGALWFTGRAIPPGKATWDDVVDEAKAGGYRLITTEELSGLHGTGAGAPFLVDTRQEWEYRTGHIQGAVNFPIEPGWWARWRKASALETFLGPDRDRTVVFY